MRVLVMLTLWLPAAQPLAAQTVSFVPSFSASTLYDDNLFNTPDGESDVTTRFSPKLDAAYKSERLALSGRYALDADWFARHQELTTITGRQEASAGATYNRSRRLVLGGTAAFTETQTPADLNVASAVAVGRARASRGTVRPTIAYQLGPRADTTAAYSITADALSGGVGLITQTAEAAVEHHRSARESLELGYQHQRFLFGTSETHVSQALTAAWTRGITRGISVTLRGGPRVTDGTLTPDIAASVTRQLRTGAMSLSYQHTQTTLIGLAGLADTSGVTAAIEDEPRPRLQLRATSQLLRTEQEGRTSMVYHVSLGCAWPLARRVGMEAGYETDLQRGNLYTQRAVQQIVRNRVSVTLAVAQSGAQPR
jgi:hypothetical protein